MRRYRHWHRPWHNNGKQPCHRIAIGIAIPTAIRIFIRVAILIYIRVAILIHIRVDILMSVPSVIVDIIITIAT